MCECHVMHEYLCAVCMPGAYGGQNRELDPPGLELQTIVSHNAGGVEELRQEDSHQFKANLTEIINPRPIWTTEPQKRPKILSTLARDPGFFIRRYEQSRHF